MRYDLPEDLVGKLWGGKYRGQEPGLLLARFAGADHHIDLDAHDPPEFCEYRWVAPDELPDLIVPFKKRVYRTVVEGFRSLV
jgi:putative (di)nucleoside polyphosphate hydrolase